MMKFATIWTQEIIKLSVIYQLEDYLKKYFHELLNLLKKVDANVCLF